MTLLARGVNPGRELLLFLPPLGPRPLPPSISPRPRSRVAPKPPAPRQPVVVLPPEQPQDDVVAIAVVVAEAQRLLLGPQQRPARRFGAVLEHPHRR
jgi:hypothetical protein